MWQSNIHCIFTFFLCSYCLVVSSNSINLGRCLQLGENFETWCGFYQSISPHTEMFFFLNISCIPSFSGFWVIYQFVLHLVDDQDTSHVFFVIYLFVFTLGTLPEQHVTYTTFYITMPLGVVYGISV
jgi:hypothetical protein